MTPTVYLTVGLPRSGKSTWARKRGLPIVEPDAIRLALHGKRFDPKREKEVWHIAHVMAKALLTSGHEAIIIDATNIHKRARGSWIRLFKDAGIEVDIQYVIFDTEPEVCRQRALETGQPDLIPVIERMARQADY